MKEYDISNPPCEIEGNYMCVLFADCDKEAGVKTVKEYIALGYRVWYDTTISSDMFWTQEIQRAIARSSLVVLLYSHEAFYSNYFWQCFFYAHHSRIFKLILHLEQERNPITKSMDLLKEKWVDPDDADFAEDINYYYINSLMSKNMETVAKKPEQDLGVHFEFWNPDFGKECTVNIRTHEAWDKNRHPLKPVSVNELSAMRENTTRFHILLPFSYAADYDGTEEDREFICQKNNACNTKVQEKHHEEHKENITTRSIFPEDYPYMDEFEYIDSNY